MYDVHFFQKWSRDMVYILGFMCADGNITQTKRGGHYVALYTNDRNLLEKMRTCMQSSHKISQRNARSGKVFRMQIGSKVWFEDLRRIGLTPAKSKRLRLPVIPKKYIGDFIRGYFDGDGHVWSGVIHKKRKTQHMTIQVGFTSASIPYLRSLLRVCRELGVRGGSIYVPKRENFGRLTFSGTDALTLYEIMYNIPHELYLERKKVVFDTFMRMRA